MSRTGFRRRLLRVALPALALPLAGAVPAALAGAPPPGIPQDVSVPLGQLVQVGGGPVSDADRAQSCAELQGGTAGARELDPANVPDVGNGLHAGDVTTAPASLPSVVPFKTGRETFNRRYWFVLRDGRVWFRSNRSVTGIDQPWRELPVPPCLYGQVSGIQADDDEMIALDGQRRVYVMDHAYREPELFNWTTRWGPLFWTGDGRTLPAGNSAWAWSVLSPREDRTWSDAAGHAHAVGDDKVSHIWMLQDDGRRMAYIDPWLAKDDSYEMCGPHRGRFRAMNLAASGSTIFVVGRYGDLYTRLFDFDISGSDPAFFAYSYADQRKATKPVIQLPSPGWVVQPKVPGTITDVITVEKHGTGSTGRTLRVEGRDAKGRTGYWEKEISARAWTFRQTGRALLGTVLSNPGRDTSARGLAPSTDRRYVHRADLLGRRALPSGAWAGEVQDFNVACSPAHVRIRLGGRSEVRLLLHTTDGLRLKARARGLDGTMRDQYGTIEVPTATRRSGDRRVRAWLRKTLGSRRFTAVPIHVSDKELKVDTVNWAFTYSRAKH